jgi:hypothetical protein
VIDDDRPWPGMSCAEHSGGAGAKDERFDFHVSRLP